jgi:hypothetical protein
MMRSTVLTVVALLLVPVMVVHAQSVSCPTTAADTTGWPTYTEGHFSLKIPPYFEEVDVKSIDSRVGKWTNGNATIYYDFGAYSNPLDPDEQGRFPALTVCQKEKGADAPRIVVYRDEDTGAPRMGAHWTVLPQGIHSSISLTISGAVPNGNSRSVMFAVIQSVRFHPRPE